MKQDEKDFLKRVQRERGTNSESLFISVRDIINEPDFPIHHKRAWYLLEKWSDKGWYDYGVTVDLGWMTDEGMGVI